MLDTMQINVCERETKIHTRVSANATVDYQFITLVISGSLFVLVL